LATWSAIASRPSRSSSAPPPARFRKAASASQGRSTGRYRLADDVERIEHVQPAEHPAFYAASRFTLNVTAPT
jgi:hypothetical protein